MGSKKHKKHKSERRERYDSPSDRPPGLKLILKVGSQGTPEHNTDWPYPGGSYSVDPNDPARSHHKKSKKKKKKKDKGKDRERKHKHHHKDKKKRKEESAGEPEEEKEEPENRPIEEPVLGVGSPGQSSREPRTCVLKKIFERTPLQKMLEHVLKALEKRDPQQFFAWPVTDNIAPGYSAIITKPMDFSTMHDKIDENEYKDLQDFMEDFKLMCDNAMKYNHVDTIYYKTSRKLLHAGFKLVQPEKIGWLLQLVPEATSKELGFEIPPELKQEKKHEAQDDQDGPTPAKRRMPATKFEAIPDDLEPEEILARAQASAREARAKLINKRGGTCASMGFLRQKKDGTTHLNILVEGTGVIPGTRKRPVLLGQLTGKLPEGTGQLQGFREDRRNVAKPVKPLYYGAFGSYAPSYDSAFSNLSKEESDLVYQTYGSDPAVQYSESILDFAKDNDYTVWMVDSLLDLLTGGEHSKTKKILDERKQLREEEEAIKTVLETKPHDTVKINLEELRSLQSVGIDVTFLQDMEEEIRLSEERHELQQRLDSMSQLLEKLQKVQYQRLSAPLPQHLSQLGPPSEEENSLATNITDNLADIAKRVNPGDIAPVAGLRKAMGVAVVETENAAGTTECDLESELRQFLESEPSLSHSPLRDDKTIEEILME